MTPTQVFDGATTSEPGGSYDAVRLVDILHPVEDPEALLLEVARPTGGFVVIKDHQLESFIVGSTPRFTDKAATNALAFPFRSTILSRQEGGRLFQSANLSADAWIGALGLYPWPPSMGLDRSLHFVVRLAIGRPE
jgi:hypothetical protein